MQSLASITRQIFCYQRQGILAEFDRLEAAEENFEKAIIRADAGQEAQNQSRNRYNDVLAKDHTRVKLK